MSGNEGIDLSRIVNIIMENPKLIEEISALAKKETAEREESEIISEKNTAEVSVQETQTPPQATDTYSRHKTRRGKRSELLGAIKPYLSEERSRVLDSVLTIAEILDLMKER